MLDQPAVAGVIFAACVGAVVFGLSYLIGGRSIALTSLFVSPLILAPISHNIVKRLRAARAPTVEDIQAARAARPRLRPRRLWSKMVLAVAVFSGAATLGAVGLDVPGHPNAKWFYLADVLVGAVWAAMAIVLTRS